MNKSPGHAKHPEHKVAEKRVAQTLEVEVKDELIANSRQVIAVDEDGNPRRYYFPRSDVSMDKLERSQTTTRCPFKGTAHYFNIIDVEGSKLKDAAWSYEEPFEEHRVLKDRLAFFDDKFAAVQIRQRT